MNHQRKLLSLKNEVEHYCRVLYHADKPCEYVNDTDIIEKYADGRFGIALEICLQSIQNIKDHFINIDEEEECKDELRNLKACVLLIEKLRKLEETMGNKTIIWNHDEITITKNEKECVAKHKDYDVIGVGSNEFEAVLELSKALGALMFSKDSKNAKVTELLGLYQEKDCIIKKYTKNSFSYLSELERLSYEISIKEKELEGMK